MGVLETLAADARHTLRAMQRARGFALTACLTLAAGIASVTAIFSYMNAIYFSELPFNDASRLASIGAGGGSVLRATATTMAAVRERQHAFERLTVGDQAIGTTLFGNDPVRLETLAVDTSFFPLFGLQPQIGRLLAKGELIGNSKVAVISDVLWRTRFGADSAVLGKSIAPLGAPLTIVGVLAPGFRFPDRTDVFVPLASMDTGDANFYIFVGKLRPGVTREQARADLAPIAKTLFERAGRPTRISVGDELLDRRGWQFLPQPYLFLTCGFLVLLIACANTGNLFLARSSDRRREMAVRASLGASRARLIAQSLADVFLIAGIATVLGVLASSWLVRLWMAFLPGASWPAWLHVAVDYRVAAFAVSLTVVIAAIAGLLPALQATRFDIARALKAGGDLGATDSKSIQSTKRGLSVQLALAVALFVGASLLATSYAKIMAVDGGYAPERIASVFPLFDMRRYPDDAQRQRLIDDIATRAALHPSVTATAVRGRFLRLLGEPVPVASILARPREDRRIFMDGKRAAAVTSDDTQPRTTVSDQYFDILGLRVRGGRTFLPTDVASSEPVVVVSSALAQQLQPSTSVVGHSLSIGAKGTRHRIIGVVDDTKELLRDPGGFSTDNRATLYFSIRQAVAFNPEILVTGRDALEARRTAVRLLAEADPMLPVYSQRQTLANENDNALLGVKAFGFILGAFAIIGLGLASIGIYGVVAFGVSRRTREIGIRIALGGTPRSVIRLVTEDAMKVAVVGLGAGVILAYGLAQTLQSMLYAVTSAEPALYVGSCILFALVTFVASFIPARRASRVNPLTSLRAE